MITKGAAMSELFIPITPVNTVKPAVKVACQYLVVTFGEGDTYATARINFIDEDGNINLAYDVKFTADELAEWSADDQFVLNLALAKLGMS